MPSRRYRDPIAVDGSPPLQPLGLHDECAQIFRKQQIGGSRGISIRLHVIPIVDAVPKAKASDPTPRTRAIIIYPMNALANSQREELSDYLWSHCDAPPATFGRYTGRQDEAERNRLASDPPNILLTNVMMLELLMTRQDDRNRAVIPNAHGPEFLVLDGLHTYLGQQSGDVAMLVRRVREALNPSLLCIGTTATMASEGTERNRAHVAADVAGCFFCNAGAGRSCRKRPARRP
jgi:Lhr-like helicase